MLELNAKSVTGLVQKSALLGWLGQTMQDRIIGVEKRRPTAEEHQKLKLYERDSDHYIERARSIGWEPETPEFLERYLQTVRGAKASNS